MADRRGQYRPYDPQRCGIYEHEDFLPKEEGNTVLADALGVTQDQAVVSTLIFRNVMIAVTMGAISRWERVARNRGTIRRYHRKRAVRNHCPCFVLKRHKFLLKFVRKAEPAGLTVIVKKSIIYRIMSCYSIERKGRKTWHLARSPQRA